ncbi:hypothetical protein PJL18_01012 [Paenarthrobacter nicotinovorans]|nr:hypothetical protein [Paenarthrobacter nicotinovorans]
MLTEVGIGGRRRFGRGIRSPGRFVRLVRLLRPGAVVGSRSRVRLPVSFRLRGALGRISGRHLIGGLGGRHRFRLIDGGKRSGRYDVDGGRVDVVDRLLDDFQHDNRDVVRGARFEREVYEDLGAFAKVLGLADHALHDVPCYVVQAIRAQQPAFAGFDVQDVQVQLRARVNVAKHAHQDVLMGMRLGFLRTEASLIDQALDERVVHADLLELLVAQAVSAGIANMREVELAVLKEQRRDRRSHA